MKEVMCDLESMSSDSNGAIAAIGGVVFDLDGEDTLETLNRADSSRCFYITVDLTEQVEKYRREISSSTIYWWLGQNEAARKRVVNNRVPLIPALMSFSDWVRNVGGQNLWGYGATFDNVLLTNAYNATMVQSPFSYRNQCCMRTIVRLSKLECPQELFTQSVQHDALDDARRQVVWLQRAWKKIHGN